MFKLLYSLARLVRQEGLPARRARDQARRKAALLKQFPKVTRELQASHFLCDALAMIIDGTVESSQLNEWLDEEIKVVEREHHAAVGAPTKSRTCFRASASSRRCWASW